MATSIYEFKDWAYGGIDPSIPGDGGEDCANFISLPQKILETIVIGLYSLFLMYWGYKKLSVPAPTSYIRFDRGGKRLLLVIMCVTLGIEIGFKFSERSAIYLLNPCHITTIMQIYLLAAPPSKKVTIVFNLQMSFINGALLAMLFPVTNTRTMPFQYEVFWVQHIMMFVVPYYLLRLGGVYRMEAIKDMSWSMLTLGLMILYHFTILQWIGMLTYVNLNTMLCPAPSDPFYGPYYRLIATVHQSLLLPLVRKGYYVISSFFLTKYSLTRIKRKVSANLTLYDHSKSGLSSNDHEKT